MSKSKYVSKGLLSLVLAALPAMAQVQNNQNPEVQSALRRIETDAGAAVVTAVSPDTGLVTFLSTQEGHAVPVTGAVSSRPEDIALSFLTAHGAAFAVKGLAAVELKEAAQRDELGIDHVRFQQVYQGVPITAGELSVHLRGNGVVAVNAETLPGLEGFDTRPAISPEEALDRARAALEKYLEIDTADVELRKPRLEILNRGLLEEGSWPTRLVWFVEARRIDLRQYLWIDARTGDVALQFSQLTSARNRLIYNANNGSTLPGTLMRSEGGPATGNADADFAYTYSGDTYNYYFTQHGRDSYDGAGAAMISTVHYCEAGFPCPFGNAFWNGSQMVYGEGFPKADDVDAHELTHAVTERTAHLYYYMQSGALNESFSDIFGETVDLTNAAGTDTAGVRWYLGEDVPGGGAIRNMMDPTIFHNPGKVSDPFFYCGTDDGGGVHLNSGVQNHAYALMVDGGTYNSVTVTGIGLTKAGKVAYRALTQYLTTGSNFVDAANALRQSCLDLVGTAGITASDCVQVSKAIDAVEMTLLLPCTSTPAQAPRLCPAGQGPANLFFDDLETSPNNWFTNNSAVWIWSNAFPYRGARHFLGGDSSSITDTNVMTLSNFALPSNSRMYFWHLWSFESSLPTLYDGGVVEYSTNGGSTWTDAAALYSAGAWYTGTLSSSFGNPLGGRSAFGHVSRGYTATRLDLASLAGQNVKFRFRIGTDSSTGADGWLIDDVRIYQCVACSQSISPLVGLIGSAGGGGSLNVNTGASCSWNATSNAAWIHLSFATGTSSGKLAYFADANPGAARSGTITVAGQTFTVYQGGATSFYTVTPCRVIDTRTTSPILSNTSRQVTVAGVCGIPSSAKAVSANITAVTPTNTGFLSIYPTGIAQPNTSSLSFKVGANRANNAVLTLAPDGTGTVTAFGLVSGGGQVHMILDVNGYFQ